MVVFRIERQKHLETTLLGEGASRQKGNRWNSFLTRMVYTSESRALATLEMAVHLDIEEDLPSDRFFVEIEIPNDLLILKVDQEDLPEGWDAKPPNIFTQAIGDDFIFKNEAAILKVPSSIIPKESNYLINPIHPASKKIKVIGTAEMNLDERIKK